MFEYIKSKDTELFLYLNGKHNPFWDVIMDFFSGKWTWLPLYLIVLIYVIYKYKKKSILIILLLIITLVLSDQLSNLIKYSVKRYRPTHNLIISHLVHTVKGYVGGQYSFVSSHAANSFGFATSLGLILKNNFKYLLVIMLLWALIVSYSRIYLGVHYPLDVICGGMIGVFCGVIINLIYLRLLNINKLKVN